MSGVSGTYTPLIIIGAARSGTNMLRDVLDKLPGIETWPCDEIPLIWRHGNLNHPNDEFTPDMARPGVRKYIQNQFDKEARRLNAQVLIEKTCSNSLRVGFTAAVIPNAKFIYIVRDGRDVVASAHKRWTADFELGYTLAKVRFMPWTDVPYHGFQFIGNRLHRKFSKEKRIAFWGPRFVGLDEALQSMTLDEVCALQWKKSVDASDRDFDAMPQDKIFRLQYEKFVEDPSTYVEQIAKFLGKNVTAQDIQNAVGGVKRSSVGKGKGELDDQTMASIEAIMRETLKRHDYV